MIGFFKKSEDEYKKGFLACLSLFSMAYVSLMETLDFSNISVMYILFHGYLLCAYFF